jgi:hypothetical protein
MFGRRWKSGQATVVARRFVTAPGDQAYEYIVDVQPDDGSPLYRVTFRHNAQDPRAPKEAAVIAVFCDIRKQDVKVDYNALEAAYRAAHNPDNAAWDAALKASPGTAAPHSLGGPLADQPPE